MRTSVNKTLLVLTGLAAISLLGGCQNWKKKYASLSVEHENLKGRYQYTAAEKVQLEQQVQENQQLIDELQRQIAEGKKTAGAATGFGDEYPVKFDPDAGTITVTLPEIILFDSGKADLKKSAGLDNILAVIKDKYAGRLIDVVGHTDSDPIKKSKWKDNWELSAQRALAVTRYFVSGGLASEDVRAVGRGDSQPIASNATAAGKAKNRRVEIVVHIK